MIFGEEKLTLEERVTRLEALLARQNLRLEGLNWRGGSISLGDQGLQVLDGTFVFRNAETGKRIVITGDGLEFYNSAGLRTIHFDTQTGDAFIAGWKIDQYTLTDANGMVGFNSESTAGTDWRIWAGGTNPATAPFRVDESGNLVANNATISGTINASSGTIGGWNITATTIESSDQTILLDSAAKVIAVKTPSPGSVTRVKLGTIGANYGIQVFKDDGVTELFGIYGNTARIAGWTVNPSSLIGGNVTLDSAGKVAVGTLNDVAVLDSTDATYRLWVGNATASSAPFRVTKAGALTATNANITGTITATSGELQNLNITGTLTIQTGGSIIAGDVTLNNSGLTAIGTGVSITLSDGTDTLWLSTTDPWLAIGGLTRSSAPFRVTKTGALTATNANITGTITSTSGTIGGWTIGASTLTGGNVTLNSAGKITVGTLNDVAILDATDTTYRLWIGNAAATSAPFRVTKAGAVTATNANITGTITATGGELQNLNITGTLNIVTGGKIQTNNGAAPYVEINDTDIVIHDAASGLPTTGKFRVLNSNAPDTEFYISLNTVGDAWTGVDHTTNGRTGFLFQDEEQIVAYLGETQLFQFDKSSTGGPKFIWFADATTGGVCHDIFQHGSTDALRAIYNNYSGHHVHIATDGYLKINRSDTTSKPTLPFIVGDGGTGYLFQVDTFGNLSAKGRLYLDGDGWIDLPVRGTTPGPAATSRRRLYVKSDGLYYVDSTGAEIYVGGTSSLFNITGTRVDVGTRLDIQTLRFKGTYNIQCWGRNLIRIYDGGGSTGDAVRIGTTSDLFTNTVKLHVRRYDVNRTSGPGGYWAAVIENNENASYRHGLLVMTRWGAAESYILEVGSHWDAVGSETYRSIFRVRGDGQIYVRGSWHADYVFEPTYKIPSIEEHAAQMWQRKRLPAFEKVREEERKEGGISSLQRGTDALLEELELAHVYIEQLHKRIVELEAVVYGMAA